MVKNENNISDYELNSLILKQIENMEEAPHWGNVRMGELNLPIRMSTEAALNLRASKSCPDGPK